LGRLFGTNGIRGIPGKDLTPELIFSVGRAVSYCMGGRIALGRDARLTGQLIFDLVASTLLECGSEIDDLGLLPTPALQYYVSRNKYDCAVMITASHNPPEFNGLKVMGSNGVEIPRTLEDEVEKYAISGRRMVSRKIGSLETVKGAIESYIEGVWNQLEVTSIISRHFRVAIDAGNGMQALAAPRLLRELGCEVVCINCDVKGDFPGRGPEPIPSKLGGLSEAVQREGCDLGVAFDGDGDRSVFSDENGTILSGDMSGAFLASYLLSTRGSGKVVTTIATSSLADWAVRETGSELIRTKVGSVDVTERMIKEGAIAGFEENGGFFFLPHLPVRDGAMALGLALSALAHYGKPMSECMARMPVFHQRKGKIPVPNQMKHEIIRMVAESAEGTVDTTDGVKVIFKDGSWVLVRASGTEPLIRVFAESTEESKAQDLYKKYTESVERLVRKH
jgi:phosphomannomutase/phosphoglucomutase